MYATSPPLGGATWRVRRGAPRPLLVCLGLLAYALYNYAFYAFGAAFNELFLVYVATLIGSTLGLIAGLTSAPLGHIVAGVRIRAADRWIGGLVLLIAILLGAFWSALAVQYAMTGDVPAMVIATGHPTNVTGVLDLWIVVSFGIWGGMWMLMGRRWGHVITTLWTVKGSVYMTALSAAAVAARGTGAAADLTQLALWIPIGVVCIVGSIVLVRTCPPESSAEGADDGAAPSRDACNTPSPATYASWTCTGRPGSMAMRPSQLKPGRSMTTC